MFTESFKRATVRNSCTILGVALGLTFILGSACNSAPTRAPYRWQGLIYRELPGVWASDKYGNLHISCDGYIHLDDQGGFDLANTGLKNAKIVELQDKALLIETMPLIKQDYPMVEYPHQEDGIWKMDFWNRKWQRIEIRDCDAKPAA